MLRPASTPVTRLGLQIPNFTYPGVPDAGLFERVSEIAADGGALRVRLGLGDGPPLPDRRDGAADERDARGLHPARGARGAHVERPSRHARHAASRTAIRRCSRRSRPRSTSSRRGARSSASARPGTSRSTGATGSSSPAARALRAAHGGRADLPSDVPRGHAELRRHLLPHRERAQHPASGDARRAADPDRWQRREVDAAARGRARGRVQPLRRPRGRSATSSPCSRRTATRSEGTLPRSRRRASAVC